MAMYHSTYIILCKLYHISVYNTTFPVCFNTYCNITYIKNYFCFILQTLLSYQHYSTAYYCFIGRLWDVGTNANMFALLLMTIDHLIAVHWSLKHATVITRRWIVGACVIAWSVSNSLKSLAAQTH